MGIFPDTQGQVTHKSLVGSCQISNPWETMGVLVACKNEEGSIKNEDTNAVTTLFIDFSERQLTPKSVKESCRNSNSSELLWFVLLPARMRIHPKMKALEWSQHFSHNKSIGKFPDAQGQLTH